MTRERFALNDLERQSPVWQRVRAHIQEQIDLLRQQNDDPTLTPEKTAHLRGRLAAFKQLLQAEAPPKTAD